VHKLHFIQIYISRNILGGILHFIWGAYDLYSLFGILKYDNRQNNLPTIFARDKSLNIPWIINKCNFKFKN